MSGIELPKLCFKIRPNCPATLPTLPPMLPDPSTMQSSSPFWSFDLAKKPATMA